MEKIIKKVCAADTTQVDYGKMAQAVMDLVQMKELGALFSRNEPMYKSIVDGLHKDIEVHQFDDEYNIMNGPWKAGFEKNLIGNGEDKLAILAIQLFKICGELNIDLEKHIDLRLMYNSMT
jgi:hypothetical protein